MNLVVVDVVVIVDVDAVVNVVVVDVVVGRLFSGFGRWRFVSRFGEGGRL